MIVSDLDTPVLLVDLDVLERNMRNMMEHCRKLGIALRVHSKAHKVPAVGHKQLAMGASGIVCQKVGEAEVMVEAGIRDILITYNIVGKPKLERLTRLAKQADIIVAIDSEGVARGISEQAQADDCTIGILVELDTGGGRTGVQSAQAALALSQRVAGMPGLDFRGIMTYPCTPEGKPFMEETMDLLEKAGLPPEIISGGGTGREAISKDQGCTETRDGCYIWEGMTRFYERRSEPLEALLDPEVCSLRVLCTAVSTPTVDRVIIDGGRKTFTDCSAPHGLVLGHPEVDFYGMSVEHGNLNVGRSKHKFQVGEKLIIIPSVTEKLVNLHDELYAVRNGKVEAVWKIAARGKIR